MTDLRHTAAPPRPELETLRMPLGGGASTTLRVARFERSRFGARVVLMRPMQRLAEWCAENDCPDALIGGFYVRSEQLPLGELRIGGSPIESRPFDSPWHTVRACVHSLDGEVSLRSRLELPPEPGGDLLQAGPMLIRDGLSLVEHGSDPEGFRRDQPRRRRLGVARGRRGAGQHPPRAARGPDPRGPQGPDRASVSPPLSPAIQDGRLRLWVQG